MCPPTGAPWGNEAISIVSRERRRLSTHHEVELNVHVLSEAARVIVARCFRIPERLGEFI